MALKQVLIINITRMGDLVQMGPLVAKLHREGPEVAVDVVVDRTCAAAAALVPGIRHVCAYDFQALIDESRVHATDVVELYRRTEAWAKPLAEAGYDRVINLTFNPPSAYLTAYVGAPDVRGATIAPDGALVIRDPWMRAFTERRFHRRFNRFNLVDIYALGGSGPAPFVPLALTVDPAAYDWARHALHRAVSTASLDGSGLSRKPVAWVAVQVGASDPLKAWRPHLFGTTMALMSRAPQIGFVLIGIAAEAAAVQEAVRAYRARLRTTGGPPVPVVNLVGRTTLSQLVAILASCRLLLTNDTGPLHIAVSVGIPTVVLSLGPVDVYETGPYGPGHWVIQPALACAPCNFDHICPHQACKDEVACDFVAALCLAALGLASVPPAPTGIRLYESGVDEDGLGAFVLRAGQEDPVTSWYARFWRRFWYEAFTGQASRIPEPQGPPPDAEAVSKAARRLLPKLTEAVTQMQQVARLTRWANLPVAAIKTAYASARTLTEQAVTLMSRLPAFAPLATAFLHDTRDVDGVSLQELADAQVRASVRLKQRVVRVVQALGLASKEQAHQLMRPASCHLNKEVRSCR
jgi:ADP-heptose:LPS heptosyltransferase